MPLIELPLNSGIDESVDKKLLPRDKLRAATNCRLDRDGRLGVRPAYTAMASTTYSANALVAYDVTNYNGRLCALGDQTGAGYPTDLFEFVSGAGAWRGTLGATVTGAALPQTTAAREIAGVPDLESSVLTAYLAAGASTLCVVRNRISVNASIQIVNPTTNQTLFSTSVAGSLGRCTFSGSKYWVIVKSGTSVLGYSFNPTTDKALTGPVTLLSGMTGIVDLAICDGPGASLFTVAVARGVTAGAQIATFNNSTGVVGTSLAVAGAPLAQGVGLAASSTLVTLIEHEGNTLTGTFQARTYNTSLVLQNGPTQLFGAGAHPSSGVQGVCSCSLVGATVHCSGTETGGTQDFQVLTQSSHALGAVTQVAGVSIDGNGCIASTSTGDFIVLQSDTASTKGLDTPTQFLVDMKTLLPQAYLIPTLGISTADRNGAVAVGSKIYFVALLAAEDIAAAATTVRAIVYEATVGTTARRQMTECGGLLHVSGGCPTVYDGFVLVEQGFGEKPGITLTATTGGSKSLGAYNVQTVWEVFDARGNKLHSLPSDPKAITLTGVNNAITVTSTVPHSIRTLASVAASQISVRVVFYCTQVGGANFQFETSTPVLLTGVWGTGVSVTLTLPDTSIAGNAVIYVQSQTPVPHAAPPPYQYSWRGRERMPVAGLPDAEQVVHSKLLFPSEPVEFAPAGRIGFTSRANQDVTGLAALDTTTVVFTQQEIGLISGRGPEQDGTGDFDAMHTLNAPGGCLTWQSIAGTPDGVMFQMAADKLMLLARDGTIAWKGQPVRDTLTSYPSITGAVHVRSQMLVAFACNNLAGNDGVIIVHDIRKDAWFVDTIGAKIDSVSEYLGRLVYVSGGTVFLQDASVGLGAAALPTMTVDFGSLAPFTPLGRGEVPTVAALLTFVGDCQVEGFFSTDDGQNFTTAGAFTLGSANAAIVNPQTGNALASGDPVSLNWTLPRQSLERLVWRLVVTAATNTGGVRIHVVELDVSSSGELNEQPASNST